MAYGGTFPTSFGERTKPLRLMTKMMTLVFVFLFGTTLNFGHGSRLLYVTMSFKVSKAPPVSRQYKPKD